MTPGLLSVILPNYNHSAFVADQIAGILAQSYRNFELIVLDDASTDHSVEVIERAIAGDARARLVRNEQNVGVIASNERGRALATGEFLFFTAADDRVLPGFFEKSVTALQQAPQAGISFSVMAWIDPSGQSARPMPMRLTAGTTYLSPEEFAHVMCGDHITGHTSILRASAFERSVPTHAQMLSLRWHVDWFFATVVACRHGAVHIPEPLVAIRDTGSNYGHGMYDWPRQREVVKTIIELLRSEAYRDVMPLFAQGGLFSGLPHVGRAVLADPDLWNVESMMIAQKALVDWALETRQRQQQHWQPQQQFQQPRGLGG